MSTCTFNHNSLRVVNVVSMFLVEFKNTEFKKIKSKYKLKVGVLPILIVLSNVLSIGPSSETNRK